MTHYKVIVYPANRSYPEECGFMVYEGSHKPAADGTLKALKQWIKEQQLPLKTGYLVDETR